MEHVKGRTFEHERISIDGKFFEDCQFIECKLIFGATDATGFDGGTVDSCEWVFEGAALRAYQLLSDLYQDGLGIGGPALIEAVFAGIREDEDEGVLLVSEPASAA